MEPQINEALTDAVRRWARPTTPEDLRRRGVTRIRSVSMTRVAALIEKAVNRTMLARTLGDFPEDAEAFSVAARSEFMRLVTDHSPEEQDPSQHEAASALARLKEQVAERRQEVEEQRRTLETVGGRVGAGDDELEGKLRELFVNWGGSATNPSPLEQEVLRVAVGELRRERARGEREKLEESTRQVEVLERRITKMNRLLEEAQAELERAVQATPDVEGVPSMFTDVQGLDGGDTQFEQKSQLMTEIFEANLQLRAAMSR